MNKRSNQKPITIKEYTKNYKFPERNKISQEDDYIHKTQSIFLSRMLKNRKIKIISWILNIFLNFFVLLK